MTTDKAAKLQHTLALELIRIGAVTFSPEKPFTWASGIRSPVYCDNRLTMSYPEIRRLITDGFQEALRSTHIEPDTVVGTATAGIPHAAWLADRLNLPMAYVRSSTKAHGRENRIEGVVEAGTEAVVVEDLISTGRSSLEAVTAVREASASVHLVLAIFSYGLPAAAGAFEAAGVDLISLTSFSHLTRVAQSEGLLEPDVVGRLEMWHSELDETMRQTGGSP